MAQSTARAYINDLNAQLQANKMQPYQSGSGSRRVAEERRAKYGYSGGADGASNNPVLLKPQNYSAAALPSATSAQQYIRDMYAAQREAVLQAYKTAYDAGMNALNAAAAKIPAQYQAARNQAAAQSELQRANFNEYAAANGLSSGAGGQAMLAMGNELQGDLSTISMAESDTLSGLEQERTQLAALYQNDIAQAIADGKLEEAYALYEEFIRVDNSIVDTARDQALENEKAWEAFNDQYQRLHQK